MPQLTHIYAAAAWFFLFMLRPVLTRCGLKPRLRTTPESYDLLLRSNLWCKHITRFTASELRKLADDLLINPDAPINSNWRYRPMHRLVLFLLVFANNWPSRKLQYATGWAANAVLNNWRYHIHQIVSVLDTPGHRQ